MTVDLLIEYSSCRSPTKHVLAIALNANDQEQIPDVLRPHDRVTLE